MSRKELAYCVWWLCVLCMLTGCKPKRMQGVANSESADTSTVAFVPPQVPVMLQGEGERARYYLTHYWQNYDFRDTTLLHLPDVSEQALVDFLQLLQSAPADVADTAIASLLHGAAVEPLSLRYFVETTTRYWYDPNSPMYNASRYALFAHHVAELPEADVAMRERAQRALRIIPLNAVGTRAGDFAFTCADGRRQRLYGVRSPLILLYFYNPDCRHCRSYTALLSASDLLNAAIESGRLKVLAVYPDNDLEAWRRERPLMPARWINAYDEHSRILADDLYDLRAMPTLYLLGSRKQVLLKDASPAEILQFLQNN